MIYIKDETANALVLTIDNNGNMAFADGTPINMLTLNGYGIIDSDGYIVHGLGSGSVASMSGSINCPPGTAITVDTLAGYVPTVQLDTVYPATQSRYVPQGSSGGHPTPEHCEFVNLWELCVHSIADVRAGSFTVKNNDRPDDLGLCAILTHSDTVVYRWL
ncbi:MAG: hypothetical protein JWM43_3909 [Acidobacteriaceae bacterium]|nr:hypothetical protein [Acidobacteriaceae bacterium]